MRPRTDHLDTEIEALIEDVFRSLGYEHVRRGGGTDEAGPVLLMEEVVDETARTVVVRCEDAATVDEATVEEFHATIPLIGGAGVARGILVTTGRVTEEARAFAARLQEQDDAYPVAVFDGETLRSLADEIGLDLAAGRLEILCRHTLPPYDPTTGVTAPLRDQVRDITNLDPTILSAPYSRVTFRPVVAVTLDRTAATATGPGTRPAREAATDVVLHANAAEPAEAGLAVTTLVTDHLQAKVTLDRDRYTTVFDAVDEQPFAQPQAAYTTQASEHLQQQSSTEPAPTTDRAPAITSDSAATTPRPSYAVDAVIPVYLPEVRHTVALGKSTYSYAYYAAGPSRVTIEDDFHRCAACGTAETDEKYTYRPTTGKIVCAAHR